MEAKLSQYASGKVRKSKKEKEQELAELKKKEEEANAARAYAEFLDAFEGDGLAKKKTGSGFVRSAGEDQAVYKPSMGTGNGGHGPAAVVLKDFGKVS